ncbi:MAG: hypothetical protein RI907_700, partial [Pseudomonadota bacterium]
MHRHPNADDTKARAATRPTSSTTLPIEGDNVLGSVQVDLDAQLRFETTTLTLTPRQLSSTPVSQNRDVEVKSWALSPDLSLKHQDHAGVGTLELHRSLADGGSERLHLWRFTLGAQVGVLRLVEQFDREIAALRTGLRPLEEAAGQCPSCKAQLPPDTDECPVCSRELEAPPSTWVLLRLWRFARPYQGQLLIGFLLTLASTGATLVPPYLTIPLMDEVLIPFQNGKPIDPVQVGWLLAGLAGSA